MALKKALLAGVAAVALAGCSTTGSTGGGGGTGDAGGDDTNVVAGTAGEARGVSIVATVNSDGTVEAGSASSTTATYDNTVDGKLAVTFAGGALDGRSLTFDTDTGELISGLEGSEDGGMLTVLDGTYSTAAVLDVFEEDAGTKIAAVHAGNATEDLPSSGSATYRGDVVGLGFSSVAGEAEGSIVVTADFNNGTVDGTISNIRITAEAGGIGALADVGFAGAVMDRENATYAGETVTIGGDVAQGRVDGGFYGPGAAETAGGIIATNDSGGLIGGYVARKD